MVRVLALIYKAEPAFTHGVFKHFHKLISVHAEAFLHLIAVKEDYYGVIRKELAQAVVQRVKIAAAPCSDSHEQTQSPSCIFRQVLLSP